MPRPSKLMRKMKVMSAKAADVHPIKTHDVNNNLNVQKLLPYITMTRDKRIESKKDVAAREYRRGLAIYRCMQLLALD